MGRKRVFELQRQLLAVDRIFREEGESAKAVNRTEFQEVLRYLSSHPNW